MLTRHARSLTLTVLLGSTLVLAGCKSDEELAAEYFASGQALIEQGQQEKALLELRNVFNHDGFHREARQLYADTLVDMGRSSEAYSQYLRLIEQYPDIVEVRQRLAEMAILQNNWDEVERHGRAALELDGTRPGVRALDLVLGYREASVARDETARAQIADAARTLLAEIRSEGDGDNAALARVVIDDYSSRGDTEATLEAVDSALRYAPMAYDLHRGKAQLLAELGDEEATGAQLQEMVTRFPGAREAQQLLLRWYLSQNDLAAAENYIRELAGPETGATAGHLSVVDFLNTFQGRDAAKAELDRLIAANGRSENARLYTARLASMLFEDGDTEGAIAGMRRAIDGAESNDATRLMQASLAQMLRSTGEIAESDALIAGILETDARHVPALKLQAQRLIEDDKPGEAIIALRTALDQTPDDAEVLTLMAYAHERDGDINLMGERLALAVEVSNEAVEESLRYAQFLMRQNRPIVAIAVLEDARLRDPENLDLLGVLGEIYIRQRQWSDAQKVANAMRDIDSDVARRAAPALQAAILRGQNRTEDSLAVLAQQLQGITIEQDVERLQTVVQIVQTQIRGGKIDEARTFLDEQLAENPDSPDLTLMSASLHTLMGDVDAAEAGYRDLIARFPESELPVRFLITVLRTNDRDDEADALLDAALERVPNAPNLLWLKASQLEKAKDFDGAIEIFDRLYDMDSDNVIIANNLASMISTYRTDPESLDRAWDIARRLRDSAVPEFQDTYGWIAYRRGDLDAALEHLEPAAAVLEDNALVQYHLGMTYAALDRKDDARAQLTRALSLAGDSPLPQFETAREALAALNTAQE